MITKTVANKHSTNVLDNFLDKFACLLFFTNNILVYQKYVFHVTRSVDLSFVKSRQRPK